ncbi:hypothetical protein [Tsukamurella tyrosinosolvens]|uniref:hypothetical protein n=1 Tax=Tsukamurella tyrosinosolvens TaxID=57704 RepID=UPI001CE19178|nr:hypothetical protein [Tsukamurella tyrosinosolvens]
MTLYQPGERTTALSGADLRGKRYHLVKRDASNNFVLAAAATDIVAGVLDYEPRRAEDAVDVVLANGTGTFKVKAGGVITKEALLTSDANGQAVVAAAGNRVFGRARTAAVAGDIVEYDKLETVAP